MFMNNLDDLWTKNNEWIQWICTEVQSNWGIFVVQFIILFFIIYGILCNLYARSLRALLKIIIVLLVFNITILYLHLTALELIFNQLWLVLGFIFIVAFQAELRRVLDRIGSSGYKFNLGMNTIRAIACAAVNMGSKKTGAIMVLERRISIDGYIYGAKSTELLDANMSQKLLENIFIKDTPLHDMAVVIRDNKILAARVLLPLTFEKRKDFGTRHSAGVGISCRSDAVAIVVSEERGSITVFCDGRKKLSINPYGGEFSLDDQNALIDCLKKYITDEETEKTHVFRKILNRILNVKEKEEEKDE